MLKKEKRTKCPCAEARVGMVGYLKHLLEAARPGRARSASVRGCWSGGPAPARPRPAPGAVTSRSWERARARARPCSPRLRGRCGLCSGGCRGWGSGPCCGISPCRCRRGPSRSADADAWPCLSAVLCASRNGAVRLRWFPGCKVAGLVFFFPCFPSSRLQGKQLGRNACEESGFTPWFLIPSLT